MHTNAYEFATAFDNGVDDQFFFGQRCGYGTGCEDEDGVVVVFEGPTVQGPVPNVQILEIEGAYLPGCRLPSPFLTN
jgi:hypothetical protein